ncbi:MAG: S41 family peptidase [Bacteroidetes bacterium]|nr:MAG: S41 family peptidase [Bacteroidota bacterium]
MKQKLNIWMPFMLSVAMVLGMVTGLKMQPTPTKITVLKPNSQNLGQGKIEELIRYVEAKYVDSVNREQLIEAAIEAIMNELDPHSAFIPAKQLATVNEQLNGNFDGIGIEFMTLDDTVVVVSPLPGGPSQKAGMLAGDRIVSVNDSLVVGLPTEGITDLLKGPGGSEVRIGVWRPATKETQTFTITRDKIPVNSVDVAYQIAPETGYLKINRFSATTYDEVMAAFRKFFEEKQLKNLIIDLRQNPGGYLQEATDILSQLFEEPDKLLVYTEGRAVNRTEYKTSGRNRYHIGKIAILIDEGSASASEIVAGAIQDWDRGVIVGRRSFGKGLVQEQYPLSDGSALRLTVARYYTPSGRSIQKDYADREAYDHDFFDRFEHGELYNKDSIVVNDTTPYMTMGGRTVYSGRGITPDIFVPLDSVLMSDLYLDLRQYATPFVFRYWETHQNQFAKMSLDDFVAHYHISDGFFREFLRFVRQKAPELNLDELPRVETQIKRFLKARLAKHIFGDEGFFAAWNAEDDVVQTALKALQSPDTDVPISLNKK